MLYPRQGGVEAMFIGKVRTQQASSSEDIPERWPMRQGFLHQQLSGTSRCWISVLGSEA